MGLSLKDLGSLFEKSACVVPSHIRSVFRYQVSPACKHIRPAPDCLYLLWELTPQVIPQLPILDVLMAKLSSEVVKGDGGAL